jgi:hypothetical protein
MVRCSAHRTYCERQRLMYVYVMEPTLQANSALGAAMDVMLMLDATKLDGLREYFMRHENELPLEDFVTGMLHFFPSDKVLHGCADVIAWP